MANIATVTGVSQYLIDQYREAAAQQALQEGYVELNLAQGTANGITIYPVESVTALADGATFFIVAKYNNTGATTLSISGLGPYALTRNGGENLLADDIVAGQIFQVIFYSGGFQLIDPAAKIGETYYGETTGTNTGYILQLNQPWSMLRRNVPIIFRAHVTCGAAPTINIEALGAVPMSNGTATVLTAGDIEQGKLYVGSYDGSYFNLIGLTNSSIDAKISSMVYSRIGSIGPAGLRNLLHNPRFLVNQRAVSGTVTLAAGVYGHDRWKAGASGCTYTLFTLQGRTALTISSGSLIQVIDGVDLFYGSNTYALSWGGTCQGKIGAGSYSASGVTGSATGGTNLNIEFGTGTLYEPQLELGSISTSFSFKDLAQDIADCKRYFNILDLSVRVYSPSGVSSWAFPVTWPAMRVTPTWAGSVATSVNANSTTMVGLSPSSGYATIQTAATGDAYIVAKFTSSGADL